MVLQRGQPPFTQSQPLPIGERFRPGDPASPQSASKPGHRNRTYNRDMAGRKGIIKIIYDEAPNT